MKKCKCLANFCKISSTGPTGSLHGSVQTLNYKGIANEMIKIEMKKKLEAVVT
jgi:hypothetical protein